MVPISEPQSGYVGKLTPPEEQKLRQFWRILIQSWDASLPTPIGALEQVKCKSATKGHRIFFSLTRSPAQPSEEETSAIPVNLLTSLKALDAGPGEIKTVQSLLLKFPGRMLRFAFLASLKQDHPDALLLRFLRAEKWNLPKAWIKLVAALNWRINEYKVDKEVLLKEKDYGEQFTLQLSSGKHFFHGCDRWNRPLCIVRVRLHDPTTQSQKPLNDYVVHCIETVRLLQVAPVESLTIVFDLTSFTVSNWEFPPIKFIIECFQQNYPESLGAMIFYNAPWFFAGMWKLIQTVLDPVVAAKVHFITGATALEEIIPRERILKELGGEEEWDYEYIGPSPDENEKLKDTAARDVILAEREKLGDEFFSLTVDWMSSSEPKSLHTRNEVIEDLRRNYWDLDPYVRARTILDRTGVIKGDGAVDFYPATRPESTKSAKSSESVHSIQSVESIETLESCKSSKSEVNEKQMVEADAISETHVPPVAA
ncbi:unnamed protein product [Penicillium bialowiezense]